MPKNVFDYLLPLEFRRCYLVFVANMDGTFAVRDLVISG